MFRLTEAQYDTLSEMAEASDLSVSEFIRVAIAEHMGRMWIGDKIPARTRPAHVRRVDAA